MSLRLPLLLQIAALAVWTGFFMGRWSSAVALLLLGAAFEMGRGAARLLRRALRGHL